MANKILFLASYFLQKKKDKRGRNYEIKLQCSHLCSGDKIERYGKLLQFCIVM